LENYDKSLFIAEKLNSLTDYSTSILLWSVPIEDKTLFYNVWNSSQSVSFSCTWNSKQKNKSSSK